MEQWSKRRGVWSKRKVLSCGVGVMYLWNFEVARKCGATRRGVECEGSGTH